MIDKDKKRFKTIVNFTAILYEQEITSDFLAMYFEDLKHFDIDQVENGFKKYRSDPSQFNKKFPKPSDISQLILGSSNKKVEDRAEIAWIQVEESIRKIGSYRSLILDDKQALSAVKSIGGWVSLCKSTYEEIVWRKKEFIKAYILAESFDSSQFPEKLLGRNEMQIEHQSDAKALKALFERMDQKKLEVAPSFY